MWLQNLFPLPQMGYRVLSEDIDEANSIDGRETDPIVLLATGSNFGVGSSASTSVPPTLYDQKPNERTRAQIILRRQPDGTVDPGVPASVKKSSCDPIAFSPLKSVGGCLSAILKHCDTMACRQAVELLISRLEGLAQLLSTPVSEGEVMEEERRKALKWKLDNILQDLVPLEQRGKALRILNGTEDADALGSLVEDIHDAVMDYQTSLRQDIYDKGCRLIETADLVLLNSIRHAADAGHRSGNRKRCLKGTRKDVLWQIERWLMVKRDQHVFWLNGPAGTGKSTISQTLAEMSFADGKLGASFFCSRDLEDRSNLHMIFPTLALQLAHRYPRFRKELLQVLRTSPNVGRETLCSQMEKFIVDPLKTTHIPTLIIIDALDECKDGEPASAILSILSRYTDQIPDVKFFITGRPEPRIRSGFRLAALRPIIKVIKLHDLERSSMDGDIKLFFRTSLVGIAKTRSDYDPREEWPNSSDLDVLCDKAAGLFIYASTAVKFIESENQSPAERLALITSLPQNTIEEEKSGIDNLYTQILEQAFHFVHVDEKGFHSRFRSVMGAVLLMFNPLPMKALSSFIRVTDIPTILSSLHSLLLVPNNEADPIRVLHGSLPDFLMDSGRCRDERFLINPSVYHREILFSCLDLMKERLKKNICDLEDYASLAEVEDIPTRRKAQIGDELEYACRFWAKHLIEVPSCSHGVEEVHKALDEFFTTCLLFWIEALIAMGDLDVGLYAINDIRRWYTSAGLICRWADDSQRFILEHADVIRDSPSEIYHSVLPLSPSSAWLREYYSTELSREVKVVKGLQAKWGPCSLTIRLDRLPRALAYRGDIVVVSFDAGDIAIFDAVTGTSMSVLSGHTNLIRSIAFSSDGTFLVSGSDDETIKSWDIQTGGIIRTFYGHTGWVYSVSISPDCTTIASGSDDKTIRLWDVWTGECRCVIDGYKKVIGSIHFSPTNPRLLISASDGPIVRWLDVDGRQIGPTYEGDDVAFSPDGTQFVSWRKGVATIRNSNSGAVVAKLRAFDFYLEHLCFSPDGKFVAGASRDTIYVWDIAGSEPYLTETFVGHTGYITSLVFSSSLISSSHDRSVKFWQIGASSTDPVTTDLESTLKLAPIKSVSLQADHGIAISSNSAGVVKVWDVSTGLCRASFHTPARDIEWGDAELIDGRLIFCWCTGGKIRLWDTKRKELQTVDVVPYFSTMGLRISWKKSRVFLLDHKSIRAWSTRTGRAAGEVMLEDEPLFNSLVVDGASAWVRFEDSRTQGWGFGRIGSSPVPLSGPSPLSLPRRHLDFIDRTRARNTDPSRIEDAVTGERVFRLAGIYRKPTTAQWDGRYLVAGYDSGVVLILDFEHMIAQ